VVHTVWEAATGASQELIRDIEMKIPEKVSQNAIYTGQRVIDDDGSFDV